MSPSSPQYRADRDRLLELLEALRVYRRAPSPSSLRPLPRYLAASDIHGNDWRLAEVLAIAQREAIDHVFLVGDLYAGTGGWAVFRRLQNHLSDETAAAGITLLWGNHEVAFVSGMLGNDRQLRFFWNFGGEQILAEAEAERAAAGHAPLPLSAAPRLTADDLTALRQHDGLREMCRWIQQTHRMVAVDAYGTAYLHAFPKIDRHGAFVFQYDGEQGFGCLPKIETDLRTATRSDERVFSPLLQTESSPVWALFEIHSARQFDAALRPHGVRQLIFGHRHHTTAVNVGGFNRQIGIAVDFDQGLGGYLVLDAAGLTWHKFVDRETHATVASELLTPAGDWTAQETHWHDVEEFLFAQLVKVEQTLFGQWSAQSVHARREFQFLESLRERGLEGVPRLYAELYTDVANREVRQDMLAAAVASGDEDAFRSFIHLLFQQLVILEGLGTDWYTETYQDAKQVLTVVLNVIREMPLSRLGLLDIRLRGTTSRRTLARLYHRILKLQDPDLALLAVQNLGAIRTTESDVLLREAFFHDVRRVRVRAAEILASQGEVAYPWVAPLLRSPDGWVRGLALWTLVEIGSGGPARSQAIRDLRRVLEREDDWFLYMLGKELLRKLGDADVSELPDRPEIPNVTTDVLEVLQEIVASEQEPFRRAFKVFYMTIELSSLVYRRGLIGMDLDDLRIYVNDSDYFPPYYRFYKAGDRDIDGRWRGWRRLWLRGETPNRLDGPQIFEITGEEDGPPLGPRTIVIYDHRWEDRKVHLPPLDEIFAQHGIGKVKDRTRHALLEQWETLEAEERSLLARIHAAVLMKMLFELPAELWTSPEDRETLQALAHKQIVDGNQQPKRILKVVTRDAQQIIHPLWLDAPKYTVVLRRQVAPP